MGFSSKNISVLLVLIFLCESYCTWDPYQVLGLNRRASAQEIRKAYKQQAKEWHPDKNKNENSEEKFVEINKAYELLTDPMRKKLYDQKGMVEDNINRYSQQNDHDMYSGGPSFFSKHGEFRFQFKVSEMNFFHQHRITIRGYENTVLPQSARQPYLLFVYSEWCLLCINLLPVWQQLVEDLTPIGVNLVTVHFDQETELAYKLGAKRGELPHIVLVMDSRTSVFNNDELTNAKMIEFIRSRFPRNLIASVDAENADNFLNGWKDNKVRVIFFGKLQRVRLRYLTSAFKFRSYATFGYVELNKETAQAFAEELNVPSKLDSLLIFHEDRRPAFQMSMADIPFATIREAIEANKYLQLPRLTSQEVMDSLCPAESSITRRRLCAILVTDDLDEDEEARRNLRKFARQFKYSRDRVTFSYIFREKQPELLRSLVQEDESFQTKLSIVVVWRQSSRYLSFSWLPQRFVSGSDNWNTSTDQLHRSLTNLIASSQNLLHETTVKELIDENAQGFFGRITSRFLMATEVLKDRITKQELLAVGSVIGTVLFIVAVGYVMAYLVRLEEEAIQRKNLGMPKTSTQTSTTTTELKLHELRSETYNGMVRLLKPGCRTVVLLLDTESMADLIPKFHKAVWPYRKNKSLLFGWMNVDRGLQWYGQLLNLAIKNVDEDEGSEMTLDSNLVRSKNCVGTVISLNGHRRYFCIYHPRHPESLVGDGRKRVQNMARRLTNSTSENAGGGAFMGFDTLSEDSDENSDVERGDCTSAHDEEPLIIDGSSSQTRSYPQLTLLGLSNWLDRLFEGSTQRYYINYWPEFGNH